MTKRERREAKAAAERAGLGAGKYVTVIAGIAVALILFTRTGAGASQTAWTKTEGVVTNAYTLASPVGSQAAGSYAVVSYTDADGTEKEATTLPLATALDEDSVGETVDIEYSAVNGVRISGNYVKDNTTRNLILAFVAVVGVYIISEFIKYILPPEMVYEAIRGKKNKNKK